MAMKTRARVSVVVEVDVPDNWTDGTTIKQVQEQAATSAGGMVRRAIESASDFHKTRMRVTQSRIVEIISVTVEG